MEIARSTRLLASRSRFQDKNGRGGEIRTHDLYVPKVMDYASHSVTYAGLPNGVENVGKYQSIAAGQTI